MKCRAKPSVCAWVQMKIATPKTTPSRFLRQRRYTNHSLPHWLPGPQLVLVGNDYPIAFGETAYRFGEVEGPKSNLDRARTHNASFDYQGLIDNEGACWHEQNVVMCACHDVRLE